MKRAQADNAPVDLVPISQVNTAASVNRKCGNDSTKIPSFLIKHKHKLPLLTPTNAISVKLMPVTATAVCEM